MAFAYMAGLYFVIAEDHGWVAKWGSDPDRQRADAKKAKFEKSKECEGCTVRIEFRKAPQCADFIRLLERMQVRKTALPKSD
jgi:hypothetical protein